MTVVSLLPDELSKEMSNLLITRLEKKTREYFLEYFNLNLLDKDKF